MRGFQAILGAGAVALAAGEISIIAASVESPSPILLLPGAIMAATLVWLCVLAVRMPASMVSVDEDGTRIRFVGFLNTVIAPGGILSAGIARHPWWGGLGVRTWFGSTVVLATAPGRVVELELRQQVRVWLLPRVFGLRAQRLRVSVERPDELVRLFPPAPTAGRPRKR